MNLYKVYVNNGKSYEEYDMDCYIIAAITKEHAESFAIERYCKENLFINEEIDTTICSANAEKILKTDNGYDIFCALRLRED